MSPQRAVAIGSIPAVHPNRVPQGGVAGSGIDDQRDARRQIYAGDWIGPMTEREGLESGLRLKAWVAPEPDCRRRPHPTDTAEIPASFKVGCDGDRLIVDRPPWRRSP